MKRIIYKIVNRFSSGTEDSPVWVENVFTKDVPYSDEAMAIAEKEAYGEITVEDIPESPAEQIAKLKAQLESTDYKIIKCSEAQLVGEELPYDITALHAERQALRDRINELDNASEEV